MRAIAASRFFGIAECRDGATSSSMSSAELRHSDGYFFFGM